MGTITNYVTSIDFFFLNNIPEVLLNLFPFYYQVIQLDQAIPAKTGLTQMDYTIINSAAATKLLNLTFISPFPTFIFLL